jgi:hypothetical protein
VSPAAGVGHAVPTTQRHASGSIGDAAHQWWRYRAGVVTACSLIIAMMAAFCYHQVFTGETCAKYYQVHHQLWLAPPYVFVHLISRSYPDARPRCADEQNNFIALWVMTCCFILFGLTFLADCAMCWQGWQAKTDVYEFSN